jgi:hypothetical protein
MIDDGIGGGSISEDKGSGCRGAEIGEMSCCISGFLNGNIKGIV